MVNYKVVNDLKEKGLYNFLVQRGIISMQVYDKVVIYEFYLEEIKTNKKMQAYENTAHHYNISDRLVMDIVKFMEFE